MFLLNTYEHSWSNIETLRLHKKIDITTKRIMCSRNFLTLTKFSINVLNVFFFFYSKKTFIQPFEYYENPERANSPTRYQRLSRLRPLEFANLFVVRVEWYFIIILFFTFINYPLII